MTTSPPRAVSIGQAARAAASDFYFNSLRFVPANVVWALAVAALLFLAATWAPAIVLTPAIAIPLVGITRMAALLTRGEPANLSDFIEGMRRFGLAASGIAAVLAIAGAMLVTNVATGFSANDPIGWFLGASALWGLVALAMAAAAVWPIVVDPAHENEPLRQRLKLAGLVIVGRPGWLLVVTILIAVVLIASTVLLGAIVLVGVAYASLFGTRWVLPAADELEARYEAARAR
jgi:uncharacterized membrane protein YesL